MNITNTSVRHYYYSHYGTISTEKKTKKKTTKEKRRTFRTKRYRSVYDTAQCGVYSVVCDRTATRSGIQCILGGVHSVGERAHVCVRKNGCTPQSVQSVYTQLLPSHSVDVQSFFFFHSFFHRLRSSIFLFVLLLLLFGSYSFGFVVFVRLFLYTPLARSFVGRSNKTETKKKKKSLCVRCDASSVNFCFILFFYFSVSSYACTARDNLKMHFFSYFFFSVFGGSEDPFRGLLHEFLCNSGLNGAALQCF